jgi:hypothetical protein
MSSMAAWQNDISTQLVASCCAFCGRKLKDASSLKAGVGADCAEMYGVLRDMPSDERAEANKLIYEIACFQTSVETAARLERLRELGLDDAVERISARLAKIVKVRIERLDGVFAIHVDKELLEPVFSEYLGMMRTIPGRRFDPATKANTVPAFRGSIDHAKMALSSLFAGQVIETPRGITVIPELHELHTMFASRYDGAEAA